MKPGITTSEFYVTVLLNIGAVAAALTGNLPPKWATIASAISVAAYSIGRGISKTATNAAPSKVNLISK